MENELYALVVDTPEDLTELVSAELFEAGAAGVEERESTVGARLTVYTESEGELERLRAHVLQLLTEQLAEHPSASEVEIEVERVPNTWQTEWTRYLKQEPLTERLVIQPTTDASAPPEGCRAIRFEPSMTFGVGSHPTTRLAARSVEAFCEGHRGCGVLDVGTGTGVLCFVAALSGCARALGVDIDPVSVESARRNAALNELESVCAFETTSLSALQEPVSLVAANIDLPTLTELAPELVRLTAPTGRLSLTGVLTAHASQLAAQLVSLGMLEVARAEDGEWTLLEYAHGKDHAAR